MAATGCENFVVVYVLLLIHVFVRAEQPCELAKIHVQGEDGNLQVLTMKQLRPTQCGTCRRGDEALSCGASVDAAASRYSARAVPRTLDLAPRVTLVFDEILIGCGTCLGVLFEKLENVPRKFLPDILNPPLAPPPRNKQPGPGAKVWQAWLNGDAKHTVTVALPSVKPKRS